MKPINKTPTIPIAISSGRFYKGANFFFDEMVFLPIIDLTLCKMGNSFFDAGSFGLEIVE